MELYERLCKNCGGDLRQMEDGRYKCNFCGSVYETESVASYADEMKKLFDEMKLEVVSNARRNLYEAVNAEYISNTRIHECCLILKQLLPDDFQANFYEVATGNNVRQITKAIRKINVEKNADYIESVILFLIRSLQTEYQLELNNLIARAFEYKDPAKFEHYCTLLAAEAVKVDTGVYETKLPREVFVAYSSKDMEKVAELVETLEAQGLKCFVAARNLRHGKGAVENYNAALEEAMDHCRALVFVSSTNSRSFNCDALTIELPYVQKKDLENAPAEYRNNYKSIPAQYKKPRVEYRIGESTVGNVADTISNEIFDGYERAYSPEEVAERVMKQLVAAPKIAPATEPQPEPKKVKYCVSCLKECDADSKFCNGCAGSKFADTLKEAELLRKIAEMEKASQTATAPAPAPTPKPMSASTVRITPGASMGLKFELNSDRKSYSVKGIGNCKDTKIIIPSICNGMPVTSIGYEAFKDCASITSITIPESVTKIGVSAFWACSSLASITIPDSVTSIDYYAFHKCSRLTSITIPNSVTDIGKGAFRECSNLTSITIPGGVTKIENYTFYQCSRLASITIPDSVTSIGNEAFLGCSLTSITIPDSVASIGNRAFDSCHYLKSIAVPSGVTSIGFGTFEFCYSLTSVTIPDSVTKICSNAFEKCSKLKTVNYIGSKQQWDAIEIDQGNDDLKNAIINSNDKSTTADTVQTTPCASDVPDFELNENGNRFAEILKEAELAKKIGEMEKTEQTSSAPIPTPTNAPVHTLQTKSEPAPISEPIPEGMEFEKNEIGYTVSNGKYCSGDVVIPATYNGLPVTKIGAFAFRRCKSLTSITIPDSVTSIFKDAFAGCSSLTSITIPNSATSVFKGAFGGCSSLTSITMPLVDEKHLGYVFGADSSAQNSIYVPESLKTVKITGCQKIVSYAFYACSNIESIIITSSVTSIGDAAFNSCSSLKSITIHDSVTSIGNGAFCHCSSLTNITIHNNITNIDKYAFLGCSSLACLEFKTPTGWRKAGGGLFSKIPEKILADPEKAAEALKTKYSNVAIERV